MAKAEAFWLVLNLWFVRNSVSHGFTMAPLPRVSGMKVEGFKYPPTAKPPGSRNTLFLGGAGVRGMDINGTFVNFTTTGIYLEGEAVPFLSLKWKRKTANQLEHSAEFFRDVVEGPFEKFTRLYFIIALSGQEFIEKVAENCMKIMKAAGKYGHEEEIALVKLKEIFIGRDRPRGSSVLFTQSPSGSFTVGFSDDSSTPKEGVAVIESKALGEAYLESVIGENGVSPAARRSLAKRLSVLLK